MKTPPVRAITALVLITFGSCLVSVGIVSVIRQFVPMPVLVSNNEVAGNYLQTLGTVYAVLLAFVVFVVWCFAAG